MEHLNALASICESAERMPVSSKEEQPENTSTEHSNPLPLPGPSSDQILRPYYNPTIPLLCATPPQYIPTIATGSYLTPPITPAGGPTSFKQPAIVETPQESSNLTLSLQYASAVTRPSNPVMRNIISYASYLQYLDETWPEKCSRRGSAVIRSSLYAQIADCLKGGASTARFRYWVRKSGFFLFEKQHPSGSYEMCIAVPFNPKSHGVTSSSSNKTNSKKPQQQIEEVKDYRLVAKLEEFLLLIGEYHNDVIGHYGIRKTYQMIQQDYTYLPRSAIAKFVQLCDVCSVRGKRVSKPREKSHKKISKHVHEEDDDNEEEEEEHEEKEDNKNSVMLLPSLPCPEGGEIEVITAESVSPASSLLQIEEETTVTLSQEPLPSSLTPSLLKDIKPTVVESVQDSSSDVIIEQQTQERQATVTNPSNQELYQQIHESVRHLLDGLTWEEMLHVFNEATDNSILTSSNVLESMLRM